MNFLRLAQGHNRLQKSPLSSSLSHAGLGSGFSVLSLAPFSIVPHSTSIYPSTPCRSLSNLASKKIGSNAASMLSNNGILGHQGDAKGAPSAWRHVGVSLEKMDLVGPRLIAASFASRPNWTPTPPKGQGPAGDLILFLQRTFSHQMSSFNILYIIIALNLIVFLLWNTIGRSHSGSQLMSRHFQVSWRNIKSGRVWTLVTSAFSQSQPFHLLFNMIGLFYLGGGVLNALGAGRFLTIYFLGAISSSMLNIFYENLVSPKINQPTRRPRGLTYYHDTPSHGASGSVMALSTVYAAMFPWQPLYLYGVLPIPAVVLVSCLVAYDLYSSMQTRHGNTAHAAHVGGALFGVLYFLRLRGFRRFRR